MVGITLLSIGVTLHVQPIFVTADEPIPVVVTLENISKKRVPYMHFPSEMCFARFYLSVEIEGIETSPPACPIRSWPGQKQKLAPGQKVERTVDLRQFVPGGKLEPGVYQMEIDVDTTPLKQYFDGDFAFGVKEQTLNRSELYVAKSSRTFRVAVGESVSLEGGDELEFTGHGHKRTYPGQTSPLLIYTKLGDTRCEPPNETQFFLKEHGFDLLDHQYDDYMKLRYFGRVGAKRIESITISHQEEEGGSTTFDVFPTGYVRVTGRASGRGYVPTHEDGWYEWADHKTLQALFDHAKANVKKHPSGVPMGDEKFGDWIEVTVRTSGTEIFFDQDVGVDGYQPLGITTELKRLGKREPATRDPVITPEL